MALWYLSSFVGWEEVRLTSWSSGRSGQLRCIVFLSGFSLFHLTVCVTFTSAFSLHLLAGRWRRSQRWAPQGAQREDRLANALGRGLGGSVARLQVCVAAAAVCALCRALLGGRDQRCQNNAATRRKISAIDPGWSLAALMRHLVGREGGGIKLCSPNSAIRRAAARLLSPASSQQASSHQRSRVSCNAAAKMTLKSAGMTTLCFWFCFSLLLSSRWAAAWEAGGVLKSACSRNLRSCGS